MPFDHPQKVLFRHCDPAGIVFFPRYAEMLNDTVEAFFSACVHWPFEEIHPAAAVPTVALSFQFRAPSRHGDALVLRLAPRALGRTSLRLETAAFCGTQVRFTADQTLVCTDGTGRPQPWPAEVRARLEPLVEEMA
jgi:4-hydroxybenzoyl-CoA thioesterase